MNLTDGANDGVAVLSDKLERMFSKAAPADKVRLDGSSKRFDALATEIMSVMTEMRKRERLVTQVDPWRWGYIIAWLNERCVELEGTMISRFDLLKRFGIWADRDFGEWVREQTGKADSTWRNWQSNARKFFFTEEGRKIIAKAGGSDAFVKKVSTDKAARVNPVTGMDKHHEAALLDEDVTSREFQHIVRTREDEYKAELERRAKREEQWIEEGQSTVWLEEEVGVFKLNEVDPMTGEITTSTIVRFPEPHTDLVGELQELMVAELRKTVGDIRRRQIKAARETAEELIEEG
jgi:hypothetical protein